MSNIDIAWSYSRIQLFRQCQRRYWYTYIGSDGGWRKDATPECHRIWLLKKIINLPIWAGSIVHDVIEKILSQKIKTKANVLPLDKAEHIAIQALRNGFLQSVNSEWLDNSKAIRLFEHHYNKPLTQSVCDEYKAKILRCLKNFYHSNIYNIIQGTSLTDWVSLEQFQKFKMNTGEKVVLKMDFAIKDSNKIKVIDWKTGKKSTDVIQQLLTYAMYAMKQLGYKLNDIIAIPVYLDNNDTEELIFTKDQLLNHIHTIKDDIVILEKAHINPNIDKFIPTLNKTQCQNCPFQEICKHPAPKEIQDGITPF